MIQTPITDNNSSIQTIKAKVELYKGSTLVSVCTCDDLLQEFTVERVGEDSKFFGFGVSHKISISLIDLYRELEPKEIDIVKVAYVEQDTIFGEEIETYPYPDLYVTEINRDETTNALSITAYDKLNKAEGHTVDELGLSSYTLEEFVAACASLLGLNGYYISTPERFSTSYESGANFEGTENIRQALTAIAEATQTIFYIDWTNSLVFRALTTYDEPVLTIDKDKYFELLTEDEVKLTRLAHATELGDNIEAGVTTSKTGSGIVTATNIADRPQELNITVFGDTTDLEVRSYGKNLISYPFMNTTKTESGITFTNNGDGTITVNGTATAQYVSFILGNTLPLEDGVTYVFSGCNDKLIVGYTNEKGESAWARGPIKWSKDYTVSLVYIQVNNGETYNNVVWSPMIRRANTSDTFEPYIGQSAAINEDGSVTGITALSPITTLSVGNNRSINMIYYKQQEEGAIQYVRNNPFWDTRADVADLVDNALAYTYGLTITPFESNWDGNIALEPTDKIAFVAEDGYLITTYLLNDSITFDGTITQVSSWKYSMDEGETANNPSSLGEALAQTFAKVDKANKQITLMVSDIQSTKNDLSNLEDGIDDKFEEINETTTELSTTLKQTAEEITIQVESVEKTVYEDGVSKVKTATNKYTFDDSGLTVAKSGAETKTTITEEGMTVSDKDDNPLLEATVGNEVQGVKAKNLKATTFLIIGDNSRFENIEGRTCCFWIGD